MLEYDAMGPMYEFLVMPKISKKQWSDNSKWTIVEFMHQEVL
jgi:hypothetical protein